MCIHVNNVRTRDLLRIHCTKLKSRRTVPWVDKQHKLTQIHTYTDLSLCFLYHFSVSSVKSVCHIITYVVQFKREMGIFKQPFLIPILHSEKTLCILERSTRYTVVGFLHLPWIEVPSSWSTQTFWGLIYQRNDQAYHAELLWYSTNKTH